MLRKDCEVMIEGRKYPVTISDDKETLLAAKAAGRVVVGLLADRGGPARMPARYLVEELSAADETYLERVVRRELGLPWIIGETKRLLIREFTMADAAQVIREPEDRDADRIFYTPELLEAYIRNQYGFFECGMWALIRKEDGRLVGKAGVRFDSDDAGDGDVSDKNPESVPGSAQESAPGSAQESESASALELGYHIFSPFRRRGYGLEACRGILDYVEKEYDSPVKAVVESWNLASIRLLERLGFREIPAEAVSGSAAAGSPVSAPAVFGSPVSAPAAAGFEVSGAAATPAPTGQKYSGSTLLHYRYEPNC